jgi:hypothetical protein
MRDAQKMVPIFERVVRRGGDMTHEETMVAFTTAPLLGRWRNFRDLGDKLEAFNGPLTVRGPAPQGGRRLRASTKCSLSRVRV